MIVVTDRRGFSLLEVLVALTVSGVVLLTIHQLIVAMTNHLDDVRRSSRTLGAEMNARRWLRAAFASIVSPSDSLPFVGVGGSLRFSTRTRRAGGWYENEQIHLDLQGSDLVAQRSVSGRLTLASEVESVAIDYWLDGESGRPWLRVWLSYGSTPRFVRLRLGRSNRSVIDTLIFVVRDHR